MMTVRARNVIVLLFVRWTMPCLAFVAPTVSNHRTTFKEKFHWNVHSRRNHYCRSRTSQHRLKTTQQDDFEFLSNLSIQELLKKLNQKQIRFSPTATRKELVALLIENKSSNNATKQLPIQELLQELDKRGIRYGPTATRRELESLLQHAQSRGGVTSNAVAKQRLSDGVSNAATEEGSSNDVTEKSNARQQQQPAPPASQPPQLPIKQLLDELDQKGIRYPPTATRGQLEALLKNHDSSINESTKEGITRPTTSRSPDRNQRQHPQSNDNPKTATRVPIRQILDELDELGVSYPPTATRSMLEDLLRRTRKDTTSLPKTGNKKHEVVVNHNIARAPDRETKATKERSRRQEKRRLRVESNRTPFNSLRDKTSAAKVKAQELPRRISTMSRKTQLSSQLSKVAQRAVQKAKQVTKTAVKWWEEADDDEKDRGKNDNVIREPDWHYVKKDTSEPIDVEAVVEKDESPPRQPPRPHRRPRDSSIPKGRVRPALQRRDSYQRTRPKRQVQPQKQNVVASKPKRLQLPSTSQDTVSFPQEEGSYKPPKNTSSARPPPRRHPAASRKPTPNQSSKTKRIYSPYDATEPERDALDRFGEAIANAAENVLWGPEDGDENSSSEASKTKSPRGADKNKPQPRHWRDRLAKRVDNAFGIPNEEEVYDSWEREVAKSKRRYKTAKDKNDPLFQYMNQYPKERKSSRQQTKRQRPSLTKKKKSAFPVTPFWEEEGNIVSVLFGRTTSGNRLVFDEFLDQTNGVNVMTTLFRSVLKSSLLVASYVCRWASVRGAVPQPVVVFGVAAAALSTRRHRLWTVGVTLVAMRTVGEMIHGYVYGDQDWEDDYYDEVDESGDDDDDEQEQPENDGDDANDN